MMDYFNIQPDDANWGKLYNDDLIAHFIWHLPGVHCPVCGDIWAIRGVIYPLMGFTGNPLGKQLEKPRAEELEVFEQLQAAVRVYVPDELPLPPGTRLGPMRGRVTGKFGDFVWPNLWDFVMRVEAYQKLASTGLRLPEPSLPDLQEKVKGKLYHLQIIPMGKMSSQAYEDPDKLICPRCGRDGRKYKKTVIEMDSIPRGVDMFRIGNFPTKVIVSERFKEVSERLGLTNISFEKIEVVS